MMHMLIIAAAALTQAQFEIVRTVEGVLADGYVEGEACAEAERCGPYIVEQATGKIVMFDGEWATGYQPTGRGEEVRKLPQPNERGDGRGAAPE